MGSKLAHGSLVPCHYCGQNKPVDQCVVRKEQVKTGKIGGSWSLGGGKFLFNKKEGSRQWLSYHTGRNIYRMQDVYVCSECLSKISGRAIGRTFLFIGIVLILILIALSESKPPTQSPANSVQPQAVQDPIQSEAKASPQPSADDGERWVVQLGAYRDSAYANDLTLKLQQQNYVFYTEWKQSPDGSSKTAVRAGPFHTREAAEAARENIKQRIGLDGIVEQQKHPAPDTQIHPGVAKQVEGPLQSARADVPGSDPAQAPDRNAGQAGSRSTGEMASAQPSTGRPQREAPASEVASSAQTAQGASRNTGQSESRPAALDPRERCAKKDNFISRTLCESKACQKPEYSAHPHCENYKQQNGGQ